MPESNVLIYLLRRDLRVSDNPILHALSTKGKDHGFTHLLPLYVFPAQQVEVSGFIPEKEPTRSPYPEARSKVANFWRCGLHRAKFLGESVWDVKQGLENVGSGLCIRVGMVGEVVREVVRAINERNDATVGAVWMVEEETIEEKSEEKDVQAVCREADVEFKGWTDEKYLIDDRDLPFEKSQDIPDVFTTYRKSVEPLREQPRSVLPAVAKGSLPPYPEEKIIPAQHSPFSIPNTLKGLQTAISRPLQAPIIKDPLGFPKGAKSAHPFLGGESTAQARLHHVLSTGAITSYKETRNGLLGTDFSSKWSAWLAHGCITARQIHTAMLAFEDGKNPATSSDFTTEQWTGVAGYGKGQNEGTQAMRFELLWRDYMRLCGRKFGHKLFRLGGFLEIPLDRWHGNTEPREGVATDIPRAKIIERFCNGTTGMGLIDASQREIFHTGYTSNRARQNVASFLAKHLNFDWRIGAEWYECMLVDYDVASNWGNWQYLAGVGVDPRGEARIFNPVKQAFDYDPEGKYVKTWVEELRVEGLETKEVFQSWTVPENKREAFGLQGLPGVEKPLVRIEFTVGRRARISGRERGRGNAPTGGDRRGGTEGEGRSYTYNPRAGGGGGGAPRRGSAPRGNYGGRGFGSTRGHLRGSGYSRGGPPWGPHGGGREARTGMMDKDREYVPDASTA